MHYVTQYSNMFIYVEPDGAGIARDNTSGGECRICVEIVNPSCKRGRLWGEGLRNEKLFRLGGSRAVYRN